MNFSKLSLAFAALATVAALSGLTACNAPDNGTGEGSGSDDVTSVLPDTSNADPSNPNSSTPTGTSTHAYTTDVLIFNGVGVSTSDWQTTETIVKNAGLSYQLVNSTQTNALTLDQLASFGMMIVPGGYGNQITSGVTAATRLKIRRAVRERGLGYLGFCAGAWTAVDPEVALDKQASYGFGVAEGTHLSLYHPNGGTPTAAIVDVTFADGTHRDLVWWGGPYTPEWSGGVVARYKTGEPAISQTVAGNGYVVVSGPHPEAPQGWRNTAGTDSDGLDYDIALDLIQAALNHTPLAVF